VPDVGSSGAAQPQDPHCCIARRLQGALQRRASLHCDRMGNHFRGKPVPTSECGHRSVGWWRFEHSMP
jgi:hypothetical protein